MTKIDKLRDDLFDGNREEVEKYIRNHGDIPKNPRFFFAACRGGLADIAADLVSGVDDVDDSNSYSDKKPLEEAAEDGLAEIVSLLLKHGAKVETEYSRYRNPLFAAVEVGCLPAVQALVAAGADMNRLCSYENRFSTPTELAAEQADKFPDLAAFLEAQNPLDSTARREHKQQEIIRRMFYDCNSWHSDRYVEFYATNNICDINSRNSDGDTLLHLAVEYPALFQSYIHSLLYYGANPELTDAAGRNVWERATPKILQWLKSRPSLLPGVDLIAILLHWKASDSECLQGIELLQNDPKLRAAVDKPEKKRLEKLGSPEALAMLKLIAKAQRHIHNTKDECQDCLRYTLKVGEHLSGSLYSPAVSNEVEWATVCESCGHRQSIFS